MTDSLLVKIAISPDGFTEVIEMLSSDRPECYGLPRNSSVKTRIQEILKASAIERVKAFGGEPSGDGVSSDVMVDDKAADQDYDGGF